MGNLISQWGFWICCAEIRDFISDAAVAADGFYPSTVGDEAFITEVLRHSLEYACELMTILVLMESVIVRSGARILFWSLESWRFRLGNCVTRSLLHKKGTIPADS